MLTAKQKFLFGEMILPFSSVIFTCKSDLVPSALDDCYLEVLNELGQSLIFDFSSYSVNPSNRQEVQLRLNTDINKTSRRFKNCEFDLDPIGISLDHTITCELITPSTIQAFDVTLYMPLQPVNLGMPVYCASITEMMTL